MLLDRLAREPAASTSEIEYGCVASDLTGTTGDRVALSKNLVSVGPTSRRNSIGGSGKSISNPATWWRYGAMLT